jgi:succinyl-diaminopimelate desuccinylase
MDIIELTRRLIERPSVTPDDAGCQALIAAQLAASGFTSEHLRFGDVDNLWARRGQGRPTLVFAGHTDVVPPGPLDEWHSDPFGAHENADGRLVGRGAADMKASLAAMISAACRFATIYPEHLGSLAFLITSDEEGLADDGTLRVMQTLAERGELFEYCVVGEPSSCKLLGDTVRHGRRGSLTGLLTIRGVQGHVAYPDQLDNPMHAFARFVNAMTAEPVDAGNEDFPATSFQVVKVESDAGAPNVVPGELNCRFNLRYSTEWTKDSLAEKVERLLSDLGIDYEIVWRVAGEPFLTRAGILTDVVRAAIRDETGVDTMLSTSGGTSDGRFIAPYGIDVVEFGPINQTIHKVNEEILIEDIFKLERIYFRIAERLLVTGDRSR